MPDFRNRETGPECNLHCPVREFRDVVRRVGSRARSLGSNAVGCAISHTFPIIPLSSVLIHQVWAMIILTPWECCEDWMDKYMKSAHTNIRGEYMHWGLVPAVNSLPLANSNVLTGSSSLCQAVFILLGSILFLTHNHMHTACVSGRIIISGNEFRFKYK